MLCYKDRTFCTFYKDCKNQEECVRPLTDKVRSEAMSWWGSDDPPIMVFTEKPDCHKKIGS